MSGYNILGYFLGLSYAFLVFLGVYDQQRKKGTILGESLEESGEFYKQYLTIWALGVIMNPAAYYFSENIYLAMLDGISAFIMLVLGILAYRRYRFFKTQKLLQEAIAKGVEIGMKKAKEA